MSIAPHNLQRDEPAVRHETAATIAPIGRTPQVRAADVSQHRAIYNLLHTTYPSYPLEDFAAWLEEPTYDPADRLLLSLGSELIGHAHVVMRYANFAGVRLPIALVREFAVQSELDCHSLHTQLLSHAERIAAERGAVLMLLAGRGIDERPGALWHTLPSQGYSAADPQEVLTRLAESENSVNRAGGAAKVALFRRMDLAGLMETYANASATQWGTIARNEPCWQWLLGRETHDATLIATLGRPRIRRRWQSSIAGYAIAKRNHVLELISTTGDTGIPLLIRLCRDAVERGDHLLTLHTPADDPLHQTLFSAGGDWSDAPRDGIRPVWCKLLDRARWIEALFPYWHERARAQGLTPPCTLSVELPDRRWELLVSRRSAHWCEDTSGNGLADITCDSSTLAALLLGTVSWQAASEAGRLSVARPQAPALLSTFFSPRLWHFTLLDWL
jgi:hypothetical protein